MTHSFRFLDDIAIADIAFEAEGDSLEEVFRGATQATPETLADRATVGVTWEQGVEQANADPAALMFDWLSEMVYWKDAAGVVFHDAPLTIVQEKASWVLRARLVGAPVDHLAQELRNDVKGVTKYRYRVAQEGKRWKARVVLDV
jgi:SHS2 domain-containing protein